jgi:anaerobic ribonucleoside-triphosphate reductase activating protein
MNVANIKWYDIADGPGVRVSLFVSGCTNGCKGCFQPETWDFNFGTPYTQETEDKIIEALRFNRCSGLSVLGGEPFEIENQKVLVNLIERVKSEVGKSVWMWTGTLYDRDLIVESDKHKRLEGVTDRILNSIDVLVDGPFVQERKNISLPYSGSDNQRVIDMVATKKTGIITDIYGNTY